MGGFAQLSLAPLGDGTSSQGGDQTARAVSRRIGRRDLTRPPMKRTGASGWPENTGNRRLMTKSRGLRS